MRLKKEKLSEAKRRITTKFLGKAGIHGVGLHPSTEETIVVYREGGDGEEEEEKVIHELRKEASPFNIEIVDTDASTITKPMPPKEAAAESCKSSDKPKGGG